VTTTRLPAAQRKAMLLDVAREVFAERGLDGTSMEEIAARAGVSKPVVYEHFGDKEGVYDAVVGQELDLLISRFTTALDGDSPRLLLEQATLALLGYIQEREDGFRILVREHGVGFATLMSDVAQQVEHLLEHQFAGRGLDTTYVGLYSQALVGQVALVGQWWHTHREAAIEDVAAHLVNLAWNGLAHLEGLPTLRST
jgi:AcrR family transcriptional regulator